MPLSIFLSKNRYGSESPPYTFSTVITLPSATSDTADLLRHARAALKRLLAPQYCVQESRGHLGRVGNGRSAAAQLVCSDQRQ